jgi:uncharacterized protein YabE (DUF348 family)
MFRSMPRLTRRARILGGVTTAVAVGAVGIGVAWGSAANAVTISIDGTETEVSTRVGTVGELLQEQGLEIEAQDAVAPAPETELSDGLFIVFRNGKLINWVVDGAERPLWTTADTVGEAVIALGDRARSAWLSVDRSKRIPVDGLAVNVRLPKSASVTVDGATETTETTAVTVADLLTEIGVTLGASDLVKPAAETAVTEGLSVQVYRVELSDFTKRVGVPFPTEKRNDSSMYVGTTKVVQAGKNGVAVQTFKRTTRDGKVVTEKLVSTEVTTQPTPKIVAVGTKKKPVSTKSYNVSADGLNWAALARCESGGNPRAVNPAGYYGLYQFSLSTWRGVGGSGNPADASSSEQTYRAQLLYKRSGAGQWPHCGKYLFT